MTVGSQTFSESYVAFSGLDFVPDFDIEQKTYPGQTNSPTNILKTILAKKVQATMKIHFLKPNCFRKKIPSFRSPTRHF